MSPLAPLTRFLDGLIGEMPRTEADVRDSLRGTLLRAFILACLGLSAFPAWVALGGPGGVFGAFAFFWALAPFPLALLLGRVGRPAAACLSLEVAFGGLVAWIAAMTGGLASPFLAWLVLVPLMLGRFGRRTLRPAAVAVGALAFVATLDLASPAFVPAWALSGVVAGVAYAALLALVMVLTGVAAMERSDPRRRSDDVIHRVVADHTLDLVTRHGAGAMVEFASPSAESLFGIRPADLAGDGYFRRINVSDRPKYLSAISDVLAGRGNATVEFRLRRPNREGVGEAQVWVEMRCRPVSGASGRPTAVLAVTRDISERKVSEAEGEEARIAAEAANAAKSRFLAHMSHELRTPLNSIVGFSEFLASDKLGSFDEARWREYARLIRQSGEHLLKVVNNLLDVSKIEAGMFTITPEPLALGDLMTDCAALMQPQAEQRSLTVETHIDADLPLVLADRQACRQILINLLSNAVKFSRVGGTIAITARDTGSAVALSVEDRGIGVAENDLPRLGIPFFQVDSAYNRNYEGTGLGLSIVKGLVSLHGGEVTIRSMAGLGTTVTVTLPFAPAATRTGTTGGFAGLLDRERKIA